MRPLKLLLGLLLLPVCYAAGRTLVDLVLSLRPEQVADLPLTFWGLLGGFALWVFIYYSLPRPMRSYVLAHELTHALWGALMGARVSDLRVTTQGGSVRLSKTNFLIVLAPYFFPLYTVLVIVGFFVLSAFYDLHYYIPFWLSLIGFTWGFHLTFTISMLRQNQSDIEESGKVFSYAVILLLNLLGLCLWIVAIGDPTLESIEASLTGHLLGIAGWVRETLPVFTS